MAACEYIIDINIEAPREKVWKIITDFKSYSKWNSILYMVKNDQLEVGKKFHVTIHDKGKDSKFYATTLSKEENQSFSAQQKVIGKWFFSATHYFIIDNTAQQNQIKFIQKWHLTGIMSKLFRKLIFKQLALFKKMNEELKTHAENIL